jgi:hypothetical protein
MAAKHIKLFEQFMSSDDIDKVKKFIEVLDFPRQNPEGYIMPSGEVSISGDILGSEYEEGYNIISKNPEILNDPEIIKEMEQYLIGDINIDTENDTVSIDYFPMSKSEYYDKNYDDDGLTYDEYLENF